MASSIQKDPIVLDLLLSLIKLHQASGNSRPFVLGLTGLQGSGKTWLVESIEATLSAPPYSYNVAVFSIDDLYHTFDNLERLRLSHPENKLVSHRGEPGTHDLELAKSTFESLLAGKDTPIPSFDKSLHAGKGDRTDPTEWRVVKGNVDVVIFEGWCVGFRAIPDEAVEAKWRKSKESGEGVLGRHGLDDVLFINHALRGYDILTDKFDAFVHLDAEKLQYVYDWRLQQEHNMIAKKGIGMSDEQVCKFIDGYIPGYELYLDQVREGVVHPKPGDAETTKRQLRITMGRNREIISSTTY